MLQQSEARAGHKFPALPHWPRSCLGAVPPLRHDSNPTKKCLEPLLKVCRQDPRDPLGAGLALVSSSARITVDNVFGFHGLRCDTSAVTAKQGT